MAGKYLEPQPVNWIAAIILLIILFLVGVIGRVSPPDPGIPLG